MTTTHRSYFAKLSPMDQSMVQRVVGFAEYSMALRILDTLVGQSTPEELLAINAIISERDEFAIYSGMSRRFTGGGGNLGHTTDAVGKNFERRGLPWVLALARVEVGAMVAALTPASRPFDAMGPTAIEREAYAELLIDGAQTHHAALARDENVNRIARRTPGNEMLTYIRRLSVARHMFDAGVRAAGDRLTATQMAVIAGQDRDLASLQGVFQQTVSDYIKAENYQTTHTSRTETRYAGWQGCRFMIAGALNELKAGTARSYDASGTTIIRN